MISLSPSRLGVFKDCPRCFWLENNRNTKRPRGAFPSLPSAMDKVIKLQHDSLRAAGKMPDFLQKAVPNAQLFADIEKLEEYRDFRHGLVYATRDIKLFGAIDDLMSEGEYVHPYDYKTKGSEPAEDYGERYYQHQLDIYALLLELNGFKTSGRGFLGFFTPSKHSFANGGFAVLFKVTMVELKTDTSRAKELVNAAVRCLRGPLPPATEGCEYCGYAAKTGGIRR